MPTVSKKWDIKSAFEHFAAVQIKGGASNVNGVIEYHSNCPWCPGSKDSLILRPETGQFTHAVRSGGCGRSGDILDLLTSDLVGMTRQDAVIEAGLEDTQFGDESEHRRPQMNRELAPVKLWQEAAMNLLTRAERYLWHPGSAEGKKALDYLHGRGFTDDTIRHFRLGYVPLQSDGRWYFSEFEVWGLDPEQLTKKDRAKGGVRVPDGILIPWFVGGAIWKLAVKRPGQTPDYGQVMGSSDALFNVDTIQYKEPAMMVEGEFDAMSVWQEAHDLVNVVATGSSAKGRSSWGNRWIAELSLASHVLQSFDEDDSGNTAARIWLDTLCGSERWEGDNTFIQRWSPVYWKDANEMLQAQGKPGSVCTVRQWVEYGLEVFQPHTLYVPPEPEKHATSTEEIKDDQPEQVEEIPPADTLAGDTEDERLLLFAESIEAIVYGALGGPKNVKIERFDGSMPRAQPEPYKPVTLPRLPRVRCPHGQITSKRVSDEMWNGTAAPCKGHVLKNGWCEEHKYSHEILEIGASLNYPEVDLRVTVRDRFRPPETVGRVILSGVANWEGYAEMVSFPHARSDIAKLKTRYSVPGRS